MFPEDPALLSEEKLTSQEISEVDVSAVDTTRPTLTITMDDAVLKVGDSAIVTFSFSEAPTGFTAGDISAPRGNLSAPVADSSKRLIYTATFTPADSTTSLTNVINVGTGWTDGAGNAPTAASRSTNYAVDTRRPTVTITMDDRALKLGDTARVTFSFSEAPTGFAAADISSPSGNLTDLKVNNGNSLVYTATFTPADSTTSSTNVITVGTNWTDGAGNAPTAASRSANYAVDKVRPTLAITMDDAALNVGDSAIVTFSFSEAPTGFTAGDISAPSGNLSAPVVNSGNPLVYTATFTPADSTTSSTNVITVGTNWTDGAGNAPTAASRSPNYAVDKVRPTLAITMDDAALNVGDSARVTFTFTKAPTGFAAADISSPSGNLTDLKVNNGNPLVYTATFTPAGSTTSLTNVITVGTGWTDGAGNAPTAASRSANYAVDTVRPTLAITMDDAALNVGDSAIVTFSFSEAPTGFTAGDISAPSGNLSAPVVNSGNPLVYTATFTPADSTTSSTNVITVGTNWTDGAGNAPTAASTSPNYAVDKVRPTLTITMDDRALKLGDTATVTFTFTKAPTGFAAGDISAPSGNLSAPVVNSGNPLVYTATFTPAGSTTSLTNVITVGTGWTDGAGNAPTAASRSANYAVDTVRPTLAITMDDAALNVGDSARVTFTFTKAPTSFTAGDISSPSGNLSAPVVNSGNSLVYTATFTPADSTTAASNVITVGTGWTDGAGNAPAVASRSPNYAVDTVIPTLTITMDDAVLNLGDTVTVTFSFSEAPTGFAAGDISSPSGNLSAPVVSSNPLVYTATFTPAASTTDATNVINVGTGWTDAAGNAPAAASRSANYAVDTVPPAVTPTVNSLITSDTTPTITGTATLGAGESLTVVVNGATYSSVMVTSDMWSIDTSAVTPSSGTFGTFTDGTSYSVTAMVTDGAGNSTADTTTDEVTVVGSEERVIDFQLSVEYKTESDYGYVSLTWPSVEGAEEYTVYSAKEPIITLVYMDDINQLEQGSRQTVTSNFINLDSFAQGDLYFYVISSNNKLSNQLKTKKIPVNTMGQNRVELTIDENMQPRVLAPITHTLISQSDITRGRLDGYSVSDFKGRIVTIDDIPLLQVTNNTPRKFADINFVLNGQGYTLNQQVSQFSSLNIKLTNIDVSTADEIHVLDPNPAYRPDVSNFSEANTDATLLNYYLIQSHLKQYFSERTTREEFYDYFLRIREESKGSLTYKWNTFIASNKAVEHRYNASGTAGVASGSWLSINWPMETFTDNRRYSYVYVVYTHERAHTLGFDHSSGLAYGFDDYVSAYMGRELNSTDNVIPPGEIIAETKDVFLYFHNNTFTAYAKPDLSSGETNYYINNLKTFVTPAINSFYITDDQLLVAAIYKGSNAFMVNGDVYEGERLTNHLVTTIVDDPFIPGVINPDIILGVTSQNYSNASNGTTGVYFVIDKPQERITSHDAGAVGGWYYPSGVTTISYQAEHEETGQLYPVTITGQQGGYKINAGLGRGNGTVLFNIDASSMSELPTGTYTGTFIIKAKGWHDSSYQEDLKVYFRYHHQADA